MAFLNIVPQTIIRCIIETCISTFMTRVFAVAWKWNQDMCPSSTECINKVYINIMKLHLVIKKNEIMIFVKN